MSVYIHAATANDAESLARLHGECFAQSWNKIAFEKLLRQPANFAFLGGANHNSLVSFVLARVAADESEILTLGTAGAARRNGFARGLVQAAATEAQARGAKVIFLEVAAANAPARAFYDALGFAVAGLRPAYYPGLNGAQADALTLRATLPL
jgi:[ribosomal protein S18]-alanine N-acetyltransferase